MVNRYLAAAILLLFGMSALHAREANAPKPSPNAAATTTDPMDVPRGMRDWFAKSVDDILAVDGPDAKDTTDRLR